MSQDKELKDLLQLTGVEKIAVLLISIGVEKSASVLREMGDDELEKVSIEIARLKNLPSHIVTGVVLQFYEMMRADKYVTQGGMDYAKEMLEGAFGLDRARFLIKRVKSATEVSGFKLLRSIQPGELLNYLQKEHPQTIALILANMDSGQASGIISELPTELQGETAYRLATMGKTSPELLQEIEEALTTQMGGSFSRQMSHSGGAKSLAEILNSASRSVETNIMEVVTQKDPELATEIKNLMFVFEDLLRLKDKDIQKILRGIDSKSLAMGLKVASEDLKKKIFKNMSQQAAEALEEEIEYLGPVRLREVEEAQLGVVEQAREMENRDEIVLTVSEEEEFVN